MNYIIITILGLAESFKAINWPGPTVTFFDGTILGKYNRWTRETLIQPLIHMSVCECVSMYVRLNHLEVYKNRVENDCYISLRWNSTRTSGWITFAWLVNQRNSENLYYLFDLEYTLYSVFHTVFYYIIIILVLCIIQSKFVFN